MESEYPVPATAPRGDSLTDLLKQLRDDTSSLVTKEVALLKTETSEKVSMLGRNLGYIAVGAFVALLGLIFVVQSAASLATIAFAHAGLAEHSLWLGPLVVGLVVAAIGLVLTAKGLKTIKEASLAPEKTIDSLKKDKEWIQHKVS